MKNPFILILLSIGFIACTHFANSQSINLFNGQDLSGWHVDVPDMDDDPDVINPFIIRNGMLVSLGTPNGHLITDDVYRDYRLEVEYRFASKPGNCGVLVHASTPRALYEMFPKSLEVQMMHENAGDFWCIVEDIKVPDMEQRRGPKEEWGITEGKKRRIINLTDCNFRKYKYVPILSSQRCLKNITKKLVTKGIDLFKKLKKYRIGNLSNYLLKILKFIFPPENNSSYEFNIHI